MLRSTTSLSVATSDSTYTSLLSHMFHFTDFSTGAINDKSDIPDFKVHYWVEYTVTHDGMIHKAHYKEQATMPVC